mgnify:CR=1 FL=1
MDEKPSNTRKTQSAFLQTTDFSCVDGTWFRVCRAPRRRGCRSTRGRGRFRRVARFGGYPPRADRKCTAGAEPFGSSCSARAENQASTSQTQKSRSSQFRTRRYWRRIISLRKPFFGFSRRPVRACGRAREHHDRRVATFRTSRRSAAFSNASHRGTASHGFFR